MNVRFRQVKVRFQQMKIQFRRVKIQFRQPSFRVVIRLRDHASRRLPDVPIGQMTDEGRDKNLRSKTSGRQIFLTVSRPSHYA